MVKYPSDQDDDAAVDGPDGSTLRIVERVGHRYLISCTCGNYFLCAPEIAVCDQCGAESPLAALREDDGGAPDGAER